MKRVLCILHNIAIYIIIPLYSNQIKTYHRVGLLEEIINFSL